MNGGRMLPIIDSQTGRPFYAKARREREALDAALSRVLRGEVRFDDGTRGMYSVDGSNYRQVPIGVVYPRDAEDVAAAMEVCRRHEVPVLPRGGGTSLAGQCCNVAVVLDFSRYMYHVLEVDPDRRLARVQPGVILDHLRKRAETHGLTFGPDPATHQYCTLGGMIGNNSCGTHSVMAGRTADNVEALEVLTWRGERLMVGRTSEEELRAIIRSGGLRGHLYERLRDLRDRYADRIRKRFPRIPRRVSGYGLEQLLPENDFHLARALVGSEGTCATTLEATVRLVPSPRATALVVLGFEDVYVAADCVPEVLAFRPIALEGLDDRLVRYNRKKGMNLGNLRYLPDGRGWLVVEFGADTRGEVLDIAHRMMRRLESHPARPVMRLYCEPHEMEGVWQVRESGLGATARVPGERDTWEGWEDAAVHPEQLGSYLREFRTLLDRYDYGCSLYGHFGDGCIHTRIDFDLKTGQGVRSFRSFVEDAADLVLRYGGSFSGEHGDGQSRAELLPRLYGEDLVAAFREFKAIWDPDDRMNPGKVVEPYRLDENLRFGADYRAPTPPTNFRFPDDDGQFVRATERCVGVGKCRKLDSGTMCPSYMVTREEEHSTRGRARVLYEMLQGGAVRGGWRDRDVHRSLDLCLSCKACKSECPVNVDMATYKAEFLSHHYRWRLRPRAAYTMGLIHVWARLASRVPGLANLTTQLPGLSGIAKRIGGMHSERSLPAFAPETFSRWFRRREARNPGWPQVLLWPDTFNDHFHPETAKAAVEVLESAGFQVVLPPSGLCCGRPLYEFGMLDLARRKLREILDALAPMIEAGLPLVALEPSCLATLKDELIGMFPEDPRARKLADNSMGFAAFLEAHADGFDWPKLERRAVYHGHCHQKALFGIEHDLALLRRIGVDVEPLDAGCCGMAGAFGFEREHYDVSLAAGERVLLPKVRDLPKSELVVADGFSCREQVAQCTDRRPVHVAQVLRMALREGPEGPPGDLPERGYVQSERDKARDSWRREAPWWIAVAAGVAGAAWALHRLGTRHA